MKLAIMQPYFMPYIGYFQAISAVDKYILYSNLNFIKKSWMNRNRVLMRDGKIVTITVPLKSKSSYSMIYDVEIDNSKPWKEKMLKTIQMCYSKKPFYKEIFDLLNSMLTPEYTHLKDLNNSTIVSISHYLDIQTVIDVDNSRFLDMEKGMVNIEEDYSDLPYLLKTKPIRKVARVIEMCRREGSNDFYNAIGGQELYSKEEFKQYDIRLNFVRTNNIEYRQDSKKGEFVQNLSIIDVLMNNGKDGTKELLQEFSIV